MNAAEKTRPSSTLNPIRIGKITYDRPTFMAPMEGITDVPFRQIVRKHGCGVTCTQMIHAEGLLRGDHKRMHETTTMDAAEHPIGFQLCGPKPEVVGEAAKKAEQMGADFIDLNMGCPAKNVVKNGAGAALLKEPLKAAQVVKAVVSSVSIPVTVKIRAGWDDQYRTGLEVAKYIEGEGAALLAAHARTRAQKFKGQADWNLIKELKERVSIPVVGNGDIFSYSDIEKMKKETDADGMMVARGALGNPWVFDHVEPSLKEICNTLLEHLDLHLAFYQRKDRALITFRKHIVWYTKGLKNAAEFRLKVFKESSQRKMIQLLKDFFAATEIEDSGDEMPAERWIMVGLDHDEEERRLRQCINKAGFRSTVVQSIEDCKSLVQRRLFLCAFLTPKLFRQMARHCPFPQPTYIVLACKEKEVSKCLNLQADNRIQDWITYPIEEKAVLAALFRSVPYIQMASELDATREANDEMIRQDATMLCTGKWADDANQWIEKARDTGDPVLIAGETGSGKQLLAKLLHYSSSRSSAPLVTVNCENTSKEQLEKEIFGEIPPRMRPPKGHPLRSKFSLAGSGTLVFDRADQLPKAVQRRLAQAITSGTFSPIGGGDRVSLHARLIFTVREDPEGRSPLKLLQRDLAKQLKGSVLRVPPLRERIEDLPTIVEGTLAKVRRDYGLQPQGITKKATKLIQRHEWPGNLRELEGVLWGSGVLAHGGKISMRALTPFISNGESAEKEEHGALEELIEARLKALFRRFKAEHLTDLHDVVLERVEKPLLDLVLKQTGGNQLKASKILGINRNTLRRKLQSYKLLD